MDTNLARAAVVVATRIVRDGRGSDVDLISAVREAHVSLFDIEPIEAWPAARAQVRGAADFAGDLVNFARVVQGGRDNG